MEVRYLVAIEEFIIEKLSCREPVQMIKFLVSQRSSSPQKIAMMVLQIADKIDKDSALVFDFSGPFIDHIPEWGIGIFLLNIETVARPWVGMCDPRHGVVVVSSNLQNLKVGNVVLFETLGLFSLASRQK
jgi:hypothetical protein